MSSKLPPTFEYQPLPINTFPPDAQIAIGPNAPGPIKMMASMGVLSTPAHLTLAALFNLSFDSNPKISSGVLNTLSAMPDELLIPALKKLEFPQVIDWITTFCDSNDRALTAISRNKNTAVSTILAISKVCSTDVADVIATNQTRLLQNPDIISALASNDNTPLTTLKSIFELATREHIPLDPSVAQKIEEKRASYNPSKEKTPSDPLANFVDEQGVDEGLFTEALLEEEARVEEERKEQEAFDKLSRQEKEALSQPIEEEQQRDLPAYALILTMSMAQKMQYLTKCGSEALNILVRDPNRIIHEAAVRSPRVRPIDVARWAKDKGLPDSVLGYIASRRDWIRSYEILYALVSNPRTPLAEAMKLINHVRTNDLRALQRNKNVSSNISRHAKILYQKRSGGG